MTTGRPPKHPRTDFGERLLLARKKLGMTQTEAAEKLGVNQKIYTFWELRAQNFSVEQIKKLSNVLNVTPNYLFGETGRKTKPIKKTK